MDKGERSESGLQEHHSASATAPATTAEDVPDPEEDDLDDLDGMSTCYTLSILPLH